MPSPNSSSESEDERYEGFVARFAHYEPDLRRFIRSLLPTWTDADEVLQQTAIVIWRKFDHQAMAGPGPGAEAREARACQKRDPLP